MAEGHESLDKVNENVREGDATFHKKNIKEETGRRNKEGAVNDNTSVASEFGLVGDYLPGKLVSKKALEAFEAG